MSSDPTLRLQVTAPAPRQRSYSPSPRNPELCDAREAAELLGLSRASFERGLKKGLIPQPAWVSGKRIWRIQDLTNFLAARVLLGKR